MACCCTPSYQLPNFNLAVDIWRQTNPTSNPPDVSTDGQLTPGLFVTHVGLPGEGGAFDTATMFLKLPAGTDVRDNGAGAGGDTVEVPAGSQRFYTVGFVDDVSKGFSNEYRFAVLLKQSGWPQPIP